MADALCGPSNALQNFQKHTSTDRTLQQDRLARPSGVAEGFRSAPGPNAGVLDAEFEAFQRSQPAPLDVYSPYAPDQAFLDPPPLQASRSPYLPDWASDFQNLQLREQDTLEKRQPFVGTHHESPAAWRNDFVKQGSSSLQQHLGSTQSQQPRHFNHNQWSQPFQPTLRPGSGFQHDEQRNAVLGEEDVDAFQKETDEMFSREFAKADKASERIEGQSESKFAEKADSQAGVQVSASTSIQPGPTERIGSDKILDAEEKQRASGVGDDDDDLARTAGVLLERVEHDQSQKFRESNFLLLMRQLRDHEVRVEDDKLVDTTQPLHPGGALYPNGNIDAESSAPVQATS